MAQTFISILSVGANLAQIVGVLVGGFAYGRLECRRAKKRKRLEQYLKQERPGRRDAGDMGQRTILHLVAALGLSEQDILDAAFSSKRIVRKTQQDMQTGLAKVLFLAYDDGKAHRPRQSERF